MIDFTGVNKFFGGEPLLKDVNFRINPGDRVGVVGPNGSGKSTLFNLITGVITPDSGVIAMPKDWQIGIMRQQLPKADEAASILDFAADAVAELKNWTRELEELEEKLSAGECSKSMLERHGVLQSKIEHAGVYSLHIEAEKALCNLGFAPEAIRRPLKSFSGGWQMRAALARVLVSDPDLLLLDEPSNYLDIPAVEYLCRFLSGYRGTLMLISHDRFLLEKLTNLTLEVNNTRVTEYPGNYAYYRREREARKKQLEAAKRNTDRRKEHLERGIERFRAKATKSSQAKSWQKALDKIEDIELPDELDYSGIIRFPEPPPCGALAVEMENLSFSYRENEPVLENVSLHIDTGDKVAFVGFNGMGKSTLLKLIAGVLKPTGGKVYLGHHIVTGYQAQEFGEILCDGQSAYDTVRAALPAGASTSVLPSVLGSFGFSGDAMNKLCKVLSGGEKIRLCLARIFVNPPNLLILDEPTTHLDVQARELLQEALKKFKGTVCLVSHDIEFVRNTANIIVAMERPHIRKYFGNYDYYLEKSAALREEKKDKTAEPEVKEKKTENLNARERRQERARRRAALAEEKKKAAAELASLEKRSSELESRINEINAMLMEGGKIDFVGLQIELDRKNKELEKVLAKWEKNALQQENILRELEKIAQELK